MPTPFALKLHRTARKFPRRRSADHLRVLALANASAANLSRRSDEALSVEIQSWLNNRERPSQPPKPIGRELRRVGHLPPRETYEPPKLPEDAGFPLHGHADALYGPCRLFTEKDMPEFPAPLGESLLSQLQHVASPEQATVFLQRLETVILVYTCVAIPTYVTNAIRSEVIWKFCSAWRKVRGYSYS